MSDRRFHPGSQMRWHTKLPPSIDSPPPSPNYAAASPPTAYGRPAYGHLADDWPEYGQPLQVAPEYGQQPHRPAQQPYYGQGQQRSPLQQMNHQPPPQPNPRPQPTYGGAPGAQPPQMYHGEPRVRSNFMSGPPAGADPQLWGWFTTADADRSGEISAEELKRALVNSDYTTTFDVDTCRMLMGMFDTDQSGTISFTEFVRLIKYVGDWQNIFNHFDADKSGSIDGQELGNALHRFGYNLTPRLLSLVEQQYGSLPGTSTTGGISFDRFVRACVVVKTLTESFQATDSSQTGWITINYE